MWRKNSVGIRDLPKRRPIAHSSSLTDSNINIPPVSGKKLRKQTVRLPENVQLPAVHTHCRQRGIRCPKKLKDDGEVSEACAEDDDGKTVKLKKYAQTTSPTICVPIPVALKEPKDVSPCQSLMIKLPAGVVPVDDNKNGSLSYRSDIMRYSKVSEKKLSFPTDFFEYYPSKGKSRIVLVDWLIQVQDYLKLQQQTLYLAVQVVDRFVMTKRVKSTKLQLVGVTSLLIAAKYEERFPPPINLLIKLTDGAYLFEEVIQMELKLLDTLRCELYIPTPMAFFDVGFDVLSRNPAIGSLSTYILDLALPYVHMLDQSPSVQAAAAIYLAHETLENEFEITSKVCLRSLMHHLDCEEEEITNCVSEFVKLLQRAAKENIQAARMKYLNKKENKNNLNQFECGKIIVEMANSNTSIPKLT
ncbi:hypothetical protein LSH36_511g01009 [Paralvinella palmiformis]|uniref:Cyclin N-terminal domain-containing protein n=1 Tax=Paralvinella palmiformis TaxID=53620 RepID=A0AAD9J951_9ANNE|nr:hypothetical protein LSH36_511g01009 [Paralvinella palmiformis]